MYYPRMADEPTPSQLQGLDAQFPSRGASRPARPITQTPRVGLHGRQRERVVLDRLLEAARGGNGGVLVVHGEPGVGKTALLDYAVEAGREFRPIRTVGVEGEMGFPFAALRQLC